LRLTSLRSSVWPLLADMPKGIHVGRARATNMSPNITSSFVPVPFLIQPKGIKSDTIMTAPRHKEGCSMPFIILDPRTGMRVAITDSKSKAEQKARRWVLRELDRLGTGPKEPVKSGYSDR
jgi:hypothetical protein